jgi:hypothetical protein
MAEDISWRSDTGGKGRRSLDDTLEVDIRLEHVGEDLDGLAGFSIVGTR